MGTESERFIVVEHVTGYMDGSYTKDAAEGMVEYWDKARPEYKHTLMQAFSFYPISDQQFLSNRYYESINGTKEK